MAPYMRTVKTSSGATAVQIVHSSRRGSRDIEHIGSAHDEVGLATLKAVAQQRLVAGQGELELGLDPARTGPGAVWVDDHLRLSPCRQRPTPEPPRPTWRD